jgi:hypothetical protein
MLFRVTADVPGSVSAVKRVHEHSWKARRAQESSLELIRARSSGSAALSEGNVVGA